MKDEKRNFFAIAIACSLALSAPLASFAAAGMPQAVSGTLPSPTYPAGSIQIALFNQLNQDRTECGFPALQENTILDKAAQNHTVYGADNQTSADVEIRGKPGFTGGTGVERVVAAGFPVDAIGGGAGANTVNIDPTSADQAIPALNDLMLASVYSEANLFTPVDLVGIGSTVSAFGGSQAIHSTFMAIDVFNTNTQAIASSPITYPCQGSTNVPLSNSQDPDPAPNVDVTGPQVLVMGNATDVIVLTSGSMTTSTGQVIPLTLLDSANDPRKLLRHFQSIAYVPLLKLDFPLKGNTTYSVSINGTVNGTPFSRNFTFTAAPDDFSSDSKATKLGMPGKGSVTASGSST